MNAFYQSNDSNGLAQLTELERIDNLFKSAVTNRPRLTKKIVFALFVLLTASTVWAQKPGSDPGASESSQTQSSWKDDLPILRRV